MLRTGEPGTGELPTTLAARSRLQFGSERASSRPPGGLQRWGSPGGLPFSIPSELHSTRFHLFLSVCSCRPGSCSTFTFEYSPPYKKYIFYFSLLTLHAGEK